MPYTLEEWCRRNKISRSSLFNMRRAGTAPRITPISPRRKIITEADDAAWIKERQAEADALIEARAAERHAEDQADGSSPA